MLYRRIENSISILSITWNVSSTFAESPPLIIPPRNLRCLLPRPCVMLHSAIPNRVGGVLPVLTDSGFNPKMEIQIIYQPDNHYWFFLSTRKDGSYDAKPAFI